MAMANAPRGVGVGPPRAKQCEHPRDGGCGCTAFQQSEGFGVLRSFSSHQVMRDAGGKGVGLWQGSRSLASIALTRVHVYPPPLPTVTAGPIVDTRASFRPASLLPGLRCCHPPPRLFELGAYASYPLYLGMLVFLFSAVFVVVLHVPRPACPVLLHVSIRPLEVT